MNDPKLPDFGSDNKPDQPVHFHFPKRPFGRTKIVNRAFQAQWFGKQLYLLIVSSYICTYVAMHIFAIFAENHSR